MGKMKAEKSSSHLGANGGRGGDEGEGDGRKDQHHGEHPQP